MRCRALAVVLLSLSAPPVLSADPTTIDDLIAKVEAARKAKAEAAAAEKLAVDALRAAVKTLNDRVAALGLDLPSPPDPKPIPPADPLAVAIRAAYTADTGAGKTEQLRDLAELYKQAADLAQVPTVTTTGQLMDRIRAAASALGIDGLLACRKLIAAECAAALGTDPDAALTAETRVKARALFTRIHEALKGANGG